MTQKTLLVTSSVTPDAGDTHLLNLCLDIETYLNTLVSDGKIAKLDKIQGSILIQTAMVSASALQLMTAVVLASLSDPHATIHADSGDSSTFDLGKEIDMALQDEGQYRVLQKGIMTPKFGDSDFNPTVAQSKLSFSYKPSKKVKAKGFFQSNEHYDDPEYFFGIYGVVVGELSATTIVFTAFLTLDYHEEEGNFAIL
jgi:hypothetical protein